LTDEADAHHIRVENQKIEAARAEAARARADAEAAKADAAAARAEAVAANANYKSLETKLEEFQRRMMALESGSCSGHSRQSSHPHYDNELDDQSVDEEEDDGL
jgi:predicted  nucleic acid-binding Zn-ribbon protein